MNNYLQFGMAGAVIVTVVLFIRYLVEKEKSERIERKERSEESRSERIALADTYTKTVAHFSNGLMETLASQKEAFVKQSETFRVLTDTIHARDGQFRAEQIGIIEEVRATKGIAKQILGEVEPK